MINDDGTLCPRHQAGHDLGRLPRLFKLHESLAQQIAHLVVCEISFIDGHCSPQLFLRFAAIALFLAPSGND